MAEKQHFQIFQDGARAWNAWRAENPEIAPDLSNLEPSVGQKQLGPINGGPINLYKAKLFRADLRNATLIGADLREADLVEAELGSARLDNADLSGARLIDASLIGADFAGVTLTGANLIGADLTGARNLTQAQIDAANGDITTHLPLDLAMPRAWIAPQAPFNQDDPVAPPRRRSIPEDPYETLGASPSDSNETIHAIYRTRAKSVHPDLNPGNQAAEEEFLRLTYAYAILKDPIRRKRYDDGEIGPDGEETEAYRYAAWRSERAQRLRKYAAVSAAVMAVTCGALLYQFAWIRPSVSVAPEPPQTALIAPAENGEAASKVKLQSRITDDRLEAEQPAETGRENAAAAPPQTDPSREVALSADATAADAPVATTVHAPKILAEPAVTAGVPVFLWPEAGANKGGPRLTSAVAPSPFLKLSSVTFTAVKTPQPATHSSPRLPPCRAKSLQITSFDWIEKFRDIEKACAQSPMTPFLKGSPAQQTPRSQKMRFSSRPETAMGKAE